VDGAAAGSETVCVELDDLAAGEGFADGFGGGVVGLLVGAFLSDDGAVADIEPEVAGGEFFRAEFVADLCGGLNGCYFDWPLPGF